MELVLAKSVFISPPNTVKQASGRDTAIDSISPSTSANSLSKMGSSQGKQALISISSTVVLQTNITGFQINKKMLKTQRLVVL